MINWILPVLGGLLLLMGCRLFWFFVGVAGFAAGLQIAPMMLGPQPFWMVWAVGLACGVIGAVLALFFQKLAIVVGGFLAGTTLALQLLPLAQSNVSILVGIVCGIAGAVGLFLFFDWVLVFLSAMIGAGLIVDSLGRHLPLGMVTYLLLAAIGVAVQARWLTGRGKMVR